VLDVAQDFVQLGGDCLFERQDSPFVERLAPLASSRPMIPTQVLAIFAGVANGF
jgi:hypothetical protein